jgi:hypothetical protein
LTSEKVTNLSHEKNWVFQNFSKKQKISTKQSISLQQSTYPRGWGSGPPCKDGGYKSLK